MKNTFESERPILFSAPMVRALRAGLKNQTRRTRGLDEINENPDAWECDGGEFDPLGWKFAHVHTGESALIRCPYGVAGDRLWTREAFALPYPELIEGCTPEMIRPSLCFRADGLESDYPTDRYRAQERVCYPPKWSPSIHMPRWASRDTLEVVSARPERLQSITEVDAVAEGSYLGRCSCAEMRMPPRTPIESAFRQTGCHIHGYDFRTRWDWINAKKFPWSKNPWVWRVEFKREFPV